jgi:hypothetical protein
VRECSTKWSRPSSRKCNRDALRFEKPGAHRWQRRARYHAQGIGRRAVEVSILKQLREGCTGLVDFVPLACCGLDAPQNMQWLTAEANRAKSDDCSACGVAGR